MIRPVQIPAVSRDRQQFTFQFADVFNGKTFWEFLRLLVRRYKGRKVFLIIDNAPCHHLDEDGNLVLATPTDSGLEVRGKVALLTERAWTAPTLSGTTLYVRDRHQVIALQLGR